MYVVKHEWRGLTFSTSYMLYIQPVGHMYIIYFTLTTSVKDKKDYSRLVKLSSNFVPINLVHECYLSLYKN